MPSEGGAAEGHPTLEHLSPSAATVFGGSLSFRLLVIHPLTGHQGPSTYRLSAAALSPPSLPHRATGMSWGGGREWGQGTESGHPLPAATSPWSLHSPLCTPGFPLSLLPGLHPSQVTLGLWGPGSEVTRACQGIPKLWKCKPLLPDLGLPSQPQQLKSQEGNLCCLPSSLLCPQPFQRAQGRLHPCGPDWGTWGTAKGRAGPTIPARTPPACGLPKERVEWFLVKCF